MHSVLARGPYHSPAPRDHDLCESHCHDSRLDSRRECDLYRNIARDCGFGFQYDLYSMVEGISSAHRDSRLYYQFAVRVNVRATATANDLALVPVVYYSPLRS